MTRVTKTEFFKRIYALPGDVMPSIVSGHNQVSGYTSHWIDKATRHVHGITTSGDGWGNNKTYQIDNGVEG